MAQFSVDRLVVLRDDEAADWVVRLCKSVRETLGADRVSAGIYNPAAQTISPFASDRPDEPELQRLTRKWRNIRLSDVPAAEAALNNGERIVMEDAANDGRLPIGFVNDFKIESILYQPLLVEGEPVGILAIEPASAADGHEELLESILPVLAASVGRVLTWRESDRRRAEAEFLLDLTEAAISERSLSELLAAVCERVARHMRVRRASVFLEQNGRMVPRMARFADGSRDAAAWAKFRRSAAPLPAVDHVMRDGKPVVAEDPTLAPDPRLVGRHLQPRLGDRRARRQALEPDRRAGARRRHAAALLQGRGADRDRRRRPHRDDHRACPGRRGALGPPACRDLDPAAAGGRLAHGLGRAGVRGAGTRDA